MADIFVSRVNDQWFVGKRRGQAIRWREWPSRRMLFRCPECDRLHTIAPEQLRPDQVMHLAPGVRLVTDHGQLADEPRWEPAS